MQKNHRVQKNHRIQKNQRSRNPGILQAFPTHRINTGKTCRNSFQKKLYFQKKQFATQNGKYSQKTSGVQEMVLRNIAPREGTETNPGKCFRQMVRCKIKKYSSPRGDGNVASGSATTLTLSIKKYSSPRGDGNNVFGCLKINYDFIKKYSSPRGDGNLPLFPSLRSVNRIKKYSSPRGDGNPEIKYF